MKVMMLDYQYSQELIIVHWLNLRMNHSDGNGLPPSHVLIQLAVLIKLVLTIASKMPPVTGNTRVLTSLKINGDSDH